MEKIEDNSVAVKSKAFAVRCSDELIRMLTSIIKKKLKATDGISVVMEDSVDYGLSSGDNDFTQGLKSALS